MCTDDHGVFQDLILFPADAEFVKVSEAAAGRVYVLKFSSSNQRHFVSSFPLCRPYLHSRIS